MQLLKIDTTHQVTPAILRHIADYIEETWLPLWHTPYPWEIIQEDTIQKLEDRIDELEDTESELDTKVSELENQVDDLTDDVDNLKDKLEDRDATIEELHTRLNSLSE